jgi:hypothetical protein
MGRSMSDSNDTEGRGGGGGAILRELNLEEVEGSLLVSGWGRVEGVNLTSSFVPSRKSKDGSNTGGGMKSNKSERLSSVASGGKLSGRSEGRFDSMSDTGIEGGGVLGTGGGELSSLLCLVLNTRVEGLPGGAIESESG